MTVFVGEENKPSLDELAHYGVKGMKWGQKKARITGDDIRDARVRVYDQTRQIRRTRKEIKKTTVKGSKEREAGQKKVAKLEMALLKNPDRITASRMTRGEKFAAALIFTPAGAAGFIGGNALGTHLVKKEVERFGGKSEGH